MVSVVVVIMVGDGWWWWLWSGIWIYAQLSIPSPPPSLRHSHDRRGAKLTELKGGEELSRNIGSNSTHLGHGFKLWWKRVDFGEGRRCWGAVRPTENR